MRPHPFAWLLGAALALAIVAASRAPDRAPAIALYWNPIYRAEIALAVLAIVYVLGVVGWMAWNGQAFRRIELPGGAALERNTAQLDAAAADAGAFNDSILQRLNAVETAIGKLNERVERLECGSDSASRRVP